MANSRITQLPVTYGIKVPSDVVVTQEVIEPCNHPPNDLIISQIVVEVIYRKVAVEPAYGGVAFSFSFRGTAITGGRRLICVPRPVHGTKPAELTVEALERKGS